MIFFGCVWFGGESLFYVAIIVPCSLYGWQLDIRICQWKLKFINWPWLLLLSGGLFSTDDTLMVSIMMFPGEFSPTGGVSIELMMARSSLISCLNVAMFARFLFLLFTGYLGWYLGNKLLQGVYWFTYYYLLFLWFTVGMFSWPVWLSDSLSPKFLCSSRWPNTFCSGGCFTILKFWYDRVCEIGFDGVVVWFRFCLTMYGFIRLYRRLVWLVGSGPNWGNRVPRMFANPFPKRFFAGHTRRCVYRDVRVTRTPQLWQVID